MTMMIEEQDIKQLVMQQVGSVVENYVISVLQQEQWQLDFEQRLQRFLQDRITAKFSNLSAIPELQTCIQASVQNLFTTGTIPGIEHYVDHDRLSKTVSSVAESLVSDVARDLMIDTEWLDRVERSLRAAMTSRLLEQVSSIDLDAYIVKAIDDGIDRWQDRLLANFRTNGIVDAAKSCELTVVDGAVVLSSALATPNLMVERDAEVSGTLRVKDFIVTGTVNVDCQSWNELAQHSADLVETRLGQSWRQQLVESVLELARTQNIEFGSVSVDGQAVLKGNVLGSGITESSLRSVGALRELRVTGRSQLSETMNVANHRVGINTLDPDAALSVWDEEICLSLGKHSRDTAFVGTSRKQRLSLGVNRQQDVSIDENGLTTIKQLRVDRWRISHHDTVPGWSGTKGDLVLNSSPKEKAPFGWSCAGGFRWIELWSR